MSRWPDWVQKLLALVLSLALCSVCAYAAIFLIFNQQSILANFRASQVQGKVEQIYNQVGAFIPSGVILLKAEKPEVHLYSFSLSDGAEQNVRIEARQTYALSSPGAYPDMLTSYQTQFAQWGWRESPLTGEATLMSIAFRSPDTKNLVVGICPVSDERDYLVFFDYDELDGCGEMSGGRLDCLASRYCSP